MRTIKAGVVGVGALGQHHARWYHDLDGVDLVGVHDTDLGRAREIAARHDVIPFDKLSDLMAQTECLSIVAPTSLHYDLAAEAIERGIHCLIEKPVTATYDQGRRLQEQARAKGVTLAVGQIERFNPAVQAIGKSGVDPAFIEAHRLAAFDPRGTDVAVVLDLMIHDIDLALKFVGSKVADIQASAVAVASGKPDIANARLTFENGAVANLTASRISLHAMRKIRLFQPSAYYSLDLAKKQADCYRLADAGEALDGMRFPLGKSDREVVYSKYVDTGQDMLAAELEAFVSAVRDQTPTAVPMEQGLEALRVALDVERIGLETAERAMAGRDR